MTRTQPNAKRVKISVYKPKVKKRSAGFGSMVVLTPFKTRRGKTIYKKVDAMPYYKPSDEGVKSPKKAVSAIPGDTNQWEASCLDDQEPHIPRTTKVRLRLQCVITV